MHYSCNSHNVLFSQMNRLHSYDESEISFYYIDENAKRVRIIFLPFSLTRLSYAALESNVGEHRICLLRWSTMMCVQYVLIICKKREYKVIYHKMLDQISNMILKLEKMYGLSWHYKYFTVRSVGVVTLGYSAVTTNQTTRCKPSMLT